MGPNIIIGILSGVSIISIAAAVYAVSQYKRKKGEELSLNEKLNQLIVSCSKKEDELKKITMKLDLNKKDLLSLQNELVSKQSELQHLISLETKGDELKEIVDKYKEQISKLISEIDSLKNEKEDLYDEIGAIKKDIDLFSPIYELTNIGFFEEPQYLYETSERFKEEIKMIRDKQKELIQQKKAIIIPEEIAIISDNTLAKKTLDGQSKVMLKAFNIETDLLLASLKPSNFSTILERIDKLATDIEKMAISFKCGFSHEYVALKYRECELQYQFKLKQEFEREEQKAIKEQMREEQQAIREFERAIEKAEKEERMYQDALELAKKELDIASSEDKDKLMAKIELLEMKLKEAIENETRAKSMAEQTRRGHVYVISNIGSFGENVYKIGMTRRLEPLDRVKELGDASVPFTFDVHAMIFSEDAPSLERELHKAFTHRRVNAINQRKEFFNVDLLEIRIKVSEVIGLESEFVMTAIAEDYYETRKLRKVA